MRILYTGVVAALACTAMGLAGCQEPESIQTYDVPRGERRAGQLNVETARLNLDHMFAAVVVDDKEAWFFKLVAPGKDAEALRKPFEDFVASIELKGGKTPAWKLPEKWQEKPGDQMRAATIEIPHEGAPLELTVSSLPFQEAWEPFLERNVNRWMDQLQQSPLKREVIEKLTRKQPLKNGEATLVELVGVMKQQSMGMMPAGHPPINKPSPAAGATAPNASTPNASAPTAGVAAAPPSGQNAEFSYDAPPSWQPDAANPMRKASFAISSGDGVASVAVTTFGAAPMMADPVANARRWAGEVGMGGAADADLEALITEIEISKLPAQYMEFVPPASAGEPKATLAAMVKRGDQMWFFKLTGARATVESQRDAFRKFLESVRFTAK